MNQCGFCILYIASFRYFFFLISITGIIIRYLLRFCMYYVREEIVRIEPFLRVSAERASHILLGKEEKRPDNSTNNNSY